MNALAPQPASMTIRSAHDGPTMAHMAGAFTVLIASSAAFVVMFLWPLVSRFV